MLNIKPVSDLRNYTEVIRDINYGSPVYLTKNGRGRYVMIDMGEYEKMEATIKLLSELSKGQQAGIKEGWLSIDDLKDSLEGEALG